MKMQVCEPIELADKREAKTDKWLRIQDKWKKGVSQAPLYDRAHDYSSD